MQLFSCYCDEAAHFPQRYSLRLSLWSIESVSQGAPLTVKETLDKLKFFLSNSCLTFKADALRALFSMVFLCEQLLITLHCVYGPTHFSVPKLTWSLAAQIVQWGSWFVWESVSFCHRVLFPGIRKIWRLSSHWDAVWLHRDWVQVVCVRLYRASVETRPQHRAMFFFYVCCCVLLC